MNRLVLIGAAVLLMTTVVWARQPTTRPGAEPPARVARPRGQFTPEEREQAMEFARENMPMLYAMIEDLPRESPRRWRLTGMAVERHRRLQRIQSEHPELYDAMLQRLRSQDEVFDLIRKFQQASDEEKSAIRAQLRVKVHELVEGWLDDREQRIENMKKMLEREIQQLQHDRQEIDDLANQHMEKLIGEMRDRMTPGDPPDDDPMHPAPPQPRREGPRPR